MRSTRSLRKGFAVAASTALALGGLLAAVGGAYAVPDNINPDTPRTLTIHKHEENASVATTPDGKGTVTGAPIGDVEFMLYKITSHDLNTVDGWLNLEKALGSADAGTNTVPTNACTDAAAGSFSVAKGEQKYEFTVDTAGAKTLVTEEDGTAKWGDGTSNGDAPEVAAYLVCETKAPDAVITPARPFVITMPFPYTDTALAAADPAKASKKWLYDVHAYPKNELGDITKKNVKQEGLGLGSEVAFEVTSSIPTLPEGYDSFKHYVVSDEFDDRLGIEQDSVVKSVTITTDPVSELAFPTDYAVEVDGQTVRVEFTETGLGKLQQNQGKKVVVVFSTTVKSLGADGIITNTATYSSSPDKDFDPNKPGIPSNEVRTKWGDVRILKFADNDESKPLRAAKFQVFDAKTPYPVDGVCTTEKADGAQAIEVEGKNTFESTEAGLVEIKGLFVSSMYEKTGADGAVIESEGNDSNERCYVLEETEPPAGYVKSDSQALKVKVGTTAPDTYDLKVENVKTLVPGLPLTGAQGKLILIGGGGLLLALAGGLIVVAARRRQNG